MTAYSYSVTLCAEGGKPATHSFATWDEALGHFNQVTVELCRLGWSVSYAADAPYTRVAQMGDLKMTAQLVTIGLN